MMEPSVWAAVLTALGAVFSGAMVYLATRGKTKVEEKEVDADKESAERNFLTDRQKAFDDAALKLLESQQKSVERTEIAYRSLHEMLRQCLERCAQCESDHLRTKQELIDLRGEIRNLQQSQQSAARVMNLPGASASSMIADDA